MTALLRPALDWLSANKSQFSIVNAQSHPYYSIKPVAELAEAADVLSRSESTANLGRELLEHAWGQFRGGDLIAALMTDVNTLVQAAIYMPFRRNGLRNAAFEQKLQASAQMAELVPPLHRLPIAATFELVGIRPPWTLRQVIDDEWAARMASPWSLTPTDLYMATHIAFYATNYGQTRERLGEMQVDYLRRWTAVWLEDLASHAQWDLVAELVIATHCIGPECADTNVWKLLEAAQREDGSIPYQANDTRAVGIAGMSPEREQFLRYYHSTLVSIMAASVCNH